MNPLVSFRRNFRRKLKRGGEKVTDLKKILALPLDIEDLEQYLY